MIIVLKQGTTEQQRKDFSEKLQQKYDVTVNTWVGTHSTVLGLLGDTSAVDIEYVQAQPIVENVNRVQEAYKKANRKFHPDNTVVTLPGGQKIGDGNISIIAGPCSVESEEQIVGIAERVKAAGAAFLRVYWKFSLPVRREHAAAALERCRTAPDLGLLRALYETVRDASAPGDTLPPRLLALERTVAGLRDLPTREALARIRCESGFGAWLLKEGGDPERLWLLDQLAARERTPAGFLARLARLGDLLRTGGDPGCPFVLSTIHSSKGLEYARVVVMDAVDGILPSSPPPAQVRDPAERPAALRAYEEERRLFYVAVTRAKDELLLLRYGAETSSGFLTQFLPEAPAPQRTPAAAPRAALTPAEAAALETALRTPGARLIHKTFGPGALQSVTGRLARIAFDDGQARTLDLAFCQARGMLKAET